MQFPDTSCMKGLLFSKVYLDQILSGEKKNDTRMHPTKVRGTIALVEKESRQIKAVAELTELRKIPLSEFAKWHNDPSSDVPMTMMPMDTNAFEYVLEDLKVLKTPVDSGDKDSHMWLDVSEDIISKFDF